jgi:hypothetical protein
MKQLRKLLGDEWIEKSVPGAEPHHALAGGTKKPRKFRGRVWMDRHSDGNDAIDSKRSAQ